MTHQRSIQLSSANEHDLMAAARCDVPVLVTSAHHDERTGCARFLHVQGPRRVGPYVEFDCELQCAARASGPPDVGKEGDQGNDVWQRFLEASGGTLFLDRIETMSPEMQARLFSFLEAIALQRDGTVPDDIRSPRIIVGASRPLWPAIAAGTFDEALFYRLNLVHLDFTTGYRERNP